MQKRTTITASLTLLSCLMLLVTGCNHSNDAGPPPPSPEQSIQRIKNDPNIPAQAKAMEIQGIQRAAEARQNAAKYAAPGKPK